MTCCPISSPLSLSLSSQTLNELPPIGSRRLRTLTIALKKARRGGGEEGRNVGLTIDGLRFIDVSTEKFSVRSAFNEIQVPPTLIAWILSAWRGKKGRGFEKSVSRNFYCGRLKTIPKEDIKFSCPSCCSPWPPLYI